MSATRFTDHLVFPCLAALAGVAACQDGAGAGAAAPAQRFDPEGCPDVFAQDLFPSYEAEISDVEWQGLVADFANLAADQAAGLDVHPYHAIVLHYGKEIVPDAMIRLKGKSSWRHAVALDPDPKMQFVLSFNEVNPDGRFHGLRKIELDMPRDDYTYLRQRLGLSFLRDVGIKSQCANNATISFNGVLYGLYTHLEHMDKEWLERVFPGAEGGDLWSDFWTRETNKTSTDDAHMVALRAATDLASFAKAVDLDETVAEWAAEAMMPDGDGFWGGAHNFAVYDHPERGTFIWLPHDLDAAFNFTTFEIDPLYWWMLHKRTPDAHFLAVVNDPEGLARFVAALEVARSRYDAAALGARVERWTAQIDAAAIDEPHRPFSLPTHNWSVTDLGEYFAKRAAVVDSWLECRKSGGEDRDGDGAVWCRDCNDADASVHPGAAEICGNGVDEDCDGVPDDGC